MVTNVHRDRQEIGGRSCSSQFQVLSHWETILPVNPMRRTIVGRNKEIPYTTQVAPHATWTA